MDEKLEAVLERIAVGVERLAEDPVVEIEAAPPACPACGRFNPEITVKESEGSGPMMEFLLQTGCNNCGQAFYAMPISWRIMTTRGQVEQELNERREINNVNP